MASDLPIGVFDSGVGGLSILKEIRAQLPYESLHYVADSAFAPYGDKPTEFITARSSAIIDFLLLQGAKAIVIACNTVTGVAVDALRQRYGVPIVATEPAVKPAVAMSRSGVVGVLATTRTLSSPNYLRLQERFGGQARILAQACPGLADRIEAGDWEGPQTRQLLAGYLQPLLTAGADTLVMGCTHYPFVSAQIRALAGEGVALVDPAIAIARELHRRLHQEGLQTALTLAGDSCFWTTGDVAQTQAVMTRLWPQSCQVQAMPAPFRDRVG